MWRWEEWARAGDETTAAWLRDLTRVRPLLAGVPPRATVAEATWYAVQLHYLVEQCQARPNFAPGREYAGFRADDFDTNFVGGEQIGAALQAARALSHAAHTWSTDGAPDAYKPRLASILHVVAALRLAAARLAQWSDLPPAPRRRTEDSLAAAQLYVAAIGYLWHARQFDADLPPLTEMPTSVHSREQLLQRFDRLASAYALWQDSVKRDKNACPLVKRGWTGRLRGRVALAQAQVAVRLHDLPAAVVLWREAAAQGEPACVTAEFLRDHVQLGLTLEQAQARVVSVEAGAPRLFRQGELPPPSLLSGLAPPAWAPRWL